MALTKVVTVKVEALTKFGFKADGKFVNYSKMFKDQANVVPGAVFDAEYYVADSGKEYLNKILSTIMASDVAAAKPLNPVIATPSTGVDTERAKKFTPKFKGPKKYTPDNSMSKDEWAAKDQRISRQGVIQAAVIALAPVVSLVLLPGEATKLAQQMLEFVNKKA